MLLCVFMEIIKKYFTLDPQQEKQFFMLGDLYRYWNEKINVISRKDIDNLYERHILHSLAIARVIQFKPGTKVMDVGTGGGFPGIPLAIMFPETDFLLVDSVGKKIKVVNAVADEIGLKNVHTVQSRAETIDGRFDFVVSRAVTGLQEFYLWVNAKICPDGFNQLPNGILYLKGGDLESELQGFNKKSTLYHLNDFFDEKFFETKKLVYLPST
jgi:16S rRNA (guanine527-N7)-methyltransferase